MEELISVIMSTYNETIEELRNSISSILNQTYKNLEFIIVNDNPQNSNILTCLDEFSDKRIVVIRNEVNKGIVESLNKAIEISNGKYIARMDADDISSIERISKQYIYLKKNGLDIVGGNLELIDRNGKNLYKQHFPEKQKRIEFFLRWGNCVPHPTWLLKKDVYLSLNGYRNIPSCEDYDFICRAIKQGFRIGNLDEYILQYRLRENSISNSDIGKQFIIRRYLVKNKNKDLSVNDIDKYIKSALFKKEIFQYNEFMRIKQSIMNAKKYYLIMKMLTNKYSYVLFVELVFIKLRNLF